MCSGRTVSKVVVIKAFSRCVGLWAFREQQSNSSSLNTWYCDLITCCFQILPTIRSVDFKMHTHAHTHNSVMNSDIGRVLVFLDMFLLEPKWYIYICHQDKFTDIGSKKKPDWRADMISEHKCIS